MKLRGAYGSVRLYVRHEHSCKHTEPDYEKCRCAKWLAVHPHGGKPRRYSLNTPSWTEGVEIASDTLKSLDPEIAAARAQKAARKRTSKTVLEAIDLWLDRTRRQFGEKARIVSQYRSTFGWVDEDGIIHGALLCFVQHYNEEHTDAPIATRSDDAARLPGVA